MAGKRVKGRRLISGSKRKKKKGRFAVSAATVITVLAIAAIALILIIFFHQPDASDVTAEPEDDPSERMIPLEEEPYVEPEPDPYYPTECFFDLENGRKSCRMEGYDCRPGIDVSEIQGLIDWEQVAADDVEFVLIRAGYRGYETGALRQDSLFFRNLDLATDYQLKVGVYFYSQAVTPEEAAEEAELVLEMLQGWQIDLPVYCDWEVPYADTARTLNVDGDTIVACCNAFCETIRAGGYQAGFYLNSYMLHHTLDPELLSDYPIWMAQYNSVPTCAVCFYTWQYSCEGTVAGIDGNVDLDLRLIPG